MTYNDLDPIISAWAKDHRLHVYTSYKGEEVRSIDVVSRKGQRFQIWVAPPSETSVTVHAWDYRKKRQEWSGPISKLGEHLDEAFETVESWIG